MEKTHSSERLLCLLCRWTLLLSLLGLLDLQPPCVVQGKRTLQNHALDPQLQPVDRKLITVNDKLAFSVLGDPGMKSPQVRVEVEAWDFCNRVGNFSSGSPSPRWADCADLQCSEVAGLSTCNVSNQVTEADNDLQTGDPFPMTSSAGSSSFTNLANADLYAVEKEKYLGSLCAVTDSENQLPWYFWTIMLKNGNFDENLGLCESFATAKPAMKSNFFTTTRRTRSSAAAQESSLSSSLSGGFPCFGKGCMNPPLVYHNWSSSDTLIDPQSSSSSVTGSFYGTYDLVDAQQINSDNLATNVSYFSVTWEKNATSGSWIFHHLLKASPNYPWLMLYLRADTTSGESGGYPWDTRGMIQQVPVTPNFIVVVTLNVIQGGGAESQFYLIDIGGCWKNNGLPCDGDVTTDVTRYSEMIINPQTVSWCSPKSLSLCPPYHVSAADGTKIYRENTSYFPYSAYHIYCSPPNAAYAETPDLMCDPYSNPQAQEIVQLLPHPEWAVHGYPANKGDGWVGDSRTWTLDVGALSNRLYFYQDPGTEPALRLWPSIDVGTEIFNDANFQAAEWTVSDFDILIPY